MEVNLIGVPLKYGSGKDGAQNGPAKLRALNIVDALSQNQNTVYDLGDINVPNFPDSHIYKWHETMKFFGPVVDTNRNLAHEVFCSLTANCFPFIIGGDHSLGLGSISGASRFFDEIAVIWIDAHGDINNSETSPSGNIHGMPLAAAMGIGHEELTDLYFKGQKVKPGNVFILGARDLDPGEVELAEKLNLNMYTMENIRSRGLDTVINEILEKINSSKVDGVHLSFDIDVLDSSIVPGTGTKVSEGFTLEEGKEILQEFLSSGFITSMDFVELNPKLDDENESTAKLCIELIKYISKFITKK